MPRKFTSKRQKIGELGETVATIYLTNHGFRVIERNYTRRWGEIDIIAEMDEKLYFIEVKSVSREKSKDYSPKTYRPEENMHPLKVSKIYRTIQTYLVDRDVPDTVDWQVDLLCVYLDSKLRQAKVKRIENIVG